MDTMEFVAILPNCMAGVLLAARKASIPNNQLVKTAPCGTPIVVLSSLNLMLWKIPLFGQTSGIEARACKILDDRYSELIPDVVAEKMKKALKRWGKPWILFRTAARMKAEF